MAKTPEQRKESLGSVEVKRVPITSVTPHPSNYNTHPASQIADLKASLKRYKQVRPVVVQKAAGENDEYVLLAGHGITQAAKELLEEDPERYAHLSEWLVAVTPANWSILDSKGYMASDNELGRMAEPNEWMLAEILQEQKDNGFDLSSLGYSEEAFNDLLEKIHPPTFEEIAKEYGEEPDEADFWPVIRMKVPPETKSRFDELMEGAQGKEEHEKFAFLLNLLDTEDVPVDEESDMFS